MSAWALSPEADITLLHAKVTQPEPVGGELKG